MLNSGGGVIFTCDRAMCAFKSGRSAAAALRVAVRVASADAATTSGDAPMIHRWPFCASAKPCGSSTHGFSMKRALLIGAPDARRGIEIVSAPLLRPVGHHDGVEIDDSESRTR